MIDRAEFEVIMKVLGIVELSVRARTSTPAILGNVAHATAVKPGQRIPKQDPNSSFVPDEIDELFSLRLDEMLRDETPETPHNADNNPDESEGLT